MFWLKKERESIEKWVKSSIDLISGPAGLMNKTSSTATSNVNEVGLATMTFSFAGKSS